MSTFANVYVGAAANDFTGDPIRNAFQKINLNFANIQSGNANITISAPVQSVAGRTGAILLTVNDVNGAASVAYINQVASAANAYVNGVAASIGSTDVAVLNANLILLDANLGTATTNINTLLTVQGNISYTMGNSQNWNTDVTTIGAALDQLAARLRAAGF